MNEDTRANALSRLKKIVGQLGGIQRMLNQDRRCGDILLQVAAAEAALMETGRVIFAGHLEAVLLEAMEAPDEQAKKETIDQLLLLFARFGGIEHAGAPESQEL